jgi:transcriptional regulator with XRE-family HTH domain
MPREPLRTETLGGRVQELREEFGWTQAELAERSGVPQATISSVERGGNPRPGTALKLAEALRATVAELKVGPDHQAKQKTHAIAARMFSPDSILGRVAQIRHLLELMSSEEEPTEEEKAFLDGAAKGLMAIRKDNAGKKGL